MLYEAEGTLKAIFDTQQKTENFKVREFVLEIQDGQYPQEIKFQLTQERCNLVDQLGEGDEVKVSFSLRGRSYTNKEGKTLYFTNLNAVKVEPTGDTIQDPNANQTSSEASDPNQDIPPDSGDSASDDIPF